MQPVELTGIDTHKITTLIEHTKVFIEFLSNDNHTTQYHTT